MWTVDLPTPKELDTFRTHTNGAEKLMSPIRVLVIPSVVIFGLYLWSRVFEPLGWLSLIGIPFAAWVAFDSRRIRITEYYSSLAYPPLTLFLLTASTPVIVVPWYLTARDLIKSGHSPRRPSVFNRVG